VTAVVHPPVIARRAASRGGAWWARAWARAVEEAAYDERDLSAGRALARSGNVSAITTDTGRFAAEVRVAAEAFRVTGALPVLGPAERDSLVEVVAAGSGRVAALLAGELPHDLVEHAEEAGVELLPYGSELATGCSCRAWVDPCEHALAVLLQLTWLVEEEPLVLLQLRGLPREELLARLHGEGSAGQEADDDPRSDLSVAVDAALRAAAVLRAVDSGGTRVEHLL
jgi:uncharacterized Zn finger protein